MFMSVINHSRQMTCSDGAQNYTNRFQNFGLTSSYIHEFITCAWERESLIDCSPLRKRPVNYRYKVTLHKNHDRVESICNTNRWALLTSLEPKEMNKPVLDLQQGVPPNNC